MEQSNKKKCKRKQQVDDSNKMRLLLLITSTENERWINDCNIMLARHILYTIATFLFLISNNQQNYNNVGFYSVQTHIRVYYYIHRFLCYVILWYGYVLLFKYGIHTRLYLVGVYVSYNNPLRTVYIIRKNNFQYMWLAVLRAYFMYVGDKKLKKYIHDSWQWWLLETRLLNSIYICISFISIYIGDRA